VTRLALLVGLGLALAGCAAARPGGDPLSAEEHNDLGVAYFGRGDHGRAAREFERAVALRPGWGRALVNLGDARLAAGQVALAIEAYERAVEAEPGDPGAANNLAWALLQDEARWREAEAIIRGALAREPEPRGYYLDTLGAALLRRGDGRAALEAFRAALADPALEGGPARALVLEHVAQAHARLGDAAAAARCRALARAHASRAGDDRAPAPRAGASEDVGADASVC
jgi:tetratricopeptide (TPR) repeat protein